jgi:hypothetical protein
MVPDESSEDGRDVRGMLYLWRWLVTLEFLEVQILNEIYTRELSIWVTSRGFQGEGRTLSKNGGR